MWEQFTIEAMSRAMSLDALTTSHPIQVPIKHAEEVEQVFDAISYYKGACVVRILHAVLGKERLDVDGLLLADTGHSKRLPVPCLQRPHGAAAVCEGDEVKWR